MKNNVGKIFILILLLAFIGEARPITKQTAIAGGVTSGVLTGLATGLVAHKITVPVKYALPSALITGSIVGYKIYLKLYEHTIEGKFLKILKIIDVIESDDFIARNFKSSRQLKGYTSTRCAGKTPFDYGQEVLRGMAINLRFAEKLLKEIYKESEGNPELDDLVGNCRLAENRINNLTESVEQVISVFSDMEQERMSRLGF